MSMSSVLEQVDLKDINSDAELISNLIFIGQLTGDVLHPAVSPGKRLMPWKFDYELSS